MCGLYGIFGKGPVQLVWDGLERIRHRGPDGIGVKLVGDAKHGHVRLSLSDLSSASSQPFIRGDTVLCFNGEVWNHKELRDALIKEGQTFTTTGDTEVFAAAIERWGIRQALPRINGMFAISCSSRDGDFIARDRFGEIPLYAVRTKDSFRWFSERKADPDFGGMASAVPPGHLVNVRTGVSEPWYIRPATPSHQPAKTIDLLTLGVSHRLWSDAPVCCLISGGLDSSIILSLCSKRSSDITAYTAVLDPASEDLKSARRLCKELSIRLIEVKVGKLTPKLFTDAVRTIEIPSKAQVEIAAMCIPLAHAIKSDGFKACLSGEAADELFTGYGNDCIRASRDDIRDVRSDSLAKMARGNFVRCNKAFMSAGVECRLPFMEQDLVESAILWDKKQSPPQKKALKVAAKQTAPAWVVSRKKETFQGGCGSDRSAEAVVHDPMMFYRSECSRLFGLTTKD